MLGTGVLILGLSITNGAAQGYFKHNMVKNNLILGIGSNNGTAHGYFKHNMVKNNLILGTGVLILGFTMLPSTCGELLRVMSF